MANEVASVLEAKLGPRAVFKNTVRHLIDRTGFSLVRMSRGPRLKPTSCTKEEYEQLERDVDALGLNDRDYQWFTTPKALMGYLLPERINFYHDVIKVCEENGVTFKDKRVLDVGVGAGYLLRLLRDEIGEGSLHGVDHYEELARIASGLAPTANIVRASIDDLKSWDETYDVITCTEVLEHIIDTETPIPTLLNLLNPGGALFIAVPNGRYDHLDPDDAFDGVSYVGHVNFWSPESWRFYLNRLTSPRRVATGTMGCHGYTNDENWAIIHNDAEAEPS